MPIAAAKDLSLRQRAMRTCLGSSLHIGVVGETADLAGLFVNCAASEFSNGRVVLASGSVDCVVTHELGRLLLRPYDFGLSEPSGELQVTLLPTPPAVMCGSVQSVSALLRPLLQGHLEYAATDINAYAQPGMRAVARPDCIVFLAAGGGNGRSPMEANFEEACAKAEMPMFTVTRGQSGGDDGGDDGGYDAEDFVCILEDTMRSVEAKSGGPISPFLKASPRQLADEHLPRILAQAGLHKASQQLSPTARDGIDALHDAILEQHIDTCYLLHRREAELRVELRDLVHCFGVVEALLRFLQPYREAGLGCASD